MRKLFFWAGLSLMLVAGCGRSSPSDQSKAALSKNDSMEAGPRSMDGPGTTGMTRDGSRSGSEMGPGMMGGMGRGMMGGMMGNSAGPGSETGTAVPGSMAENDNGTGPVTSLELGPIDPSLAEKGGNLYNSDCASCHALNGKRMGPALGDIVRERTPEFIMNMILNPQEMEQKDPIARRLLSEYGVPMPALGLERDQARAILEYLRTTAKPAS